MISSGDQPPSVTGATQPLGTPPIPDSVTSVYDDANLVLAIHRAVVQFRERWQVILPIEHWTRVKALTRRLGHLGENEYSTLRPVANLIDFLQTRVRPFLGSPLRWESTHGATDEMMPFAVNKIVQEVSRRLHEWVEQRIVQDQIISWRKAYAHHGIGSGRTRRRDVEFIYSEAVPIPGQIADPPSNEFLREIQILIRDSIRHAGGKLEGLSSLKAESEADSIAEAEQLEAEACAEFEADPAHREDGSLT